MINTTHYQQTFKLLLLGLITFFSTASFAETPRERLNNFFTKVTTMQAGFIQEVHDKKGKLKQKSRGTLYIKRPGRFRWDYRNPEQHQIVADGKNVWIYDVGLEQVTVKPISRALSAAPVGLLTRKQPVEQQFHVQELESATGNLDWFQLRPKRGGSDFTTLQLGLDRQGVREMILQDKFGQETSIHLHGSRLNSNIPPQKFRFVPPPHADVIGRAS